jgi:putative hydrolase of the HAD superfamily
MGMSTIHVAPMAAPADHIHHHTADLAQFLSTLVRA